MAAAPFIHDIWSAPLALNRAAAGSALWLVPNRRFGCWARDYRLPLSRGIGLD
jgi:hypothetical protein